MVVELHRMDGGSSSEVSTQDSVTIDSVVCRCYLNFYLPERATMLDLNYGGRFAPHEGSIQRRGYGIEGRVYMNGTIASRTMSYGRPQTEGVI